MSSEVIEEIAVIPNTIIRVEKLGNKHYIRVRLNYTITDVYDMATIDGYLQALRGFIRILTKKYIG